MSNITPFNASDGSMIQQVKWSDGVLNLIQKAA